MPSIAPFFLLVGRLITIWQEIFYLPTVHIEDRLEGLPIAYVQREGQQVEDTPQQY